MVRLLLWFLLRLFLHFRPQLVLLPLIFLVPYLPCPRAVDGVLRVPGAVHDVPFLGHIMTWRCGVVCVCVWKGRGWATGLRLRRHFDPFKLRSSLRPPVPRGTRQNHTCTPHLLKKKLRADLPKSVFRKPRSWSVVVHPTSYAEDDGLRARLSQPPSPVLHVKPSPTAFNDGHACNIHQ